MSLITQKICLIVGETSLKLERILIPLLEHVGCLASNWSCHVETTVELRSKLTIFFHLNFGRRLLHSRHRLLAWLLNWTLRWIVIKLLPLLRRSTLVAKGTLRPFLHLLEGSLSVVELPCSFELLRIKVSVPLRSLLESKVSSLCKQIDCSSSLLWDERTYLVIRNTLCMHQRTLVPSKHDLLIHPS